MFYISEEAKMKVRITARMAEAVHVNIYNGTYCWNLALIIGTIYFMTSKT